ncbi:MAG: hypothetical protein LUC32_07150 [Clostridiales bacterium]|nr:hypothetical protein [Clostridiales bacterium]
MEVIRMRFDAKSERWMPMRIRGIDGYFSDVRINRNSIPDGFHFWELADGESDGIPCRYRPFILVNFFGTFISTENLPVDDEECRAGYIDSENDWGFIGDRYLTLTDIMDEEYRRMREKRVLSMYQGNGGR